MGKDRKLPARMCAGSFLFAVLVYGNIGTAGPRNNDEALHRPSAGIATFYLADDSLRSRGIEIASHGQLFARQEPQTITFRLSEQSTFRSLKLPNDSAKTDEVSLVVPGAILLASKSKRFAIGDFIISNDGGDQWTVRSRLGRASENLLVFQIINVVAGFLDETDHFHLRGDLVVTKEFARSAAIGLESGAIVGRIVIEPYSDQIDADPTSTPDLGDGTHLAEPSPESTRAAESVGPDIIVSKIHDVDSYGTLAYYQVSAFSIGTWSCNSGDEPASWYANTNEHPVIAQNLYRLMDGRFEQIGMSWLKHGFQAVTGDICDLGCVSPPQGSNQLGIGCSDPYSAGLNGQQSNLGPRSDVNAHTGEFIYPWDAPPADPNVGRRLQVNNADLDPALNSGALYFAEAIYVSADDAAAGNQDNNAAYRRVAFDEALGDYTMNLTGITRSRWPGIRAWDEWGPPALRTNVKVPNEGLIIVSAYASDLGNGFWNYEYAVQNLNSDRSIDSFRIPVEPGAVVTNIGFHDVDYHSGEPYDGADWPATHAGGAVTWSTATFAENPNANAIRWGTLYNFRFDADVPPHDVQATLGLFKPGTPTSVTALTTGPLIPPPSCGNSLVEGTEECDPPDSVICDGTCRAINNDAIRGGRLWDNWPVTTSLPPMVTDHPLYPPTSAETGSATWRCVECHGWDYQGIDGAYGSGVHFTGIGGVLNSGLSAGDLFDLIKSSNSPNGHGYGDAGLADEDIRDLVQFLLDLAINTDSYIYGNGNFSGNDALGQSLYESAGSISCVSCHGIAGTTINFGTLVDPVWIGTIASEDPWKLLHKIRLGHPGSLMPSWTGNGGSNQDAANIGLFAQLGLPAVCSQDFHCDDGLFCNGAETCSAGSCLPGAPNCVGQPCDEGNDICGQADPYRGGLLWDKWWLVNDAPEPIGSHPLYPAVGQKSGSTTFRCKECHGWDYQGVAGAYGAGSHFTGIPGVLGSTMPAQDMFNMLAAGQGIILSGHGYAELGLQVDDIWDLVQFVQMLTIDTELYIDGSGTFTGNAAQGEINFTTAGSVSCSQCHGADGTLLNFGTDNDPAWIGTIAVANPWELMHKIRFGQAGTPMPSWSAGGGSDQGVADIGRFAQENLPVDCLTQQHCEDELFCTGAETCVDGICVSDGDPCLDGACEEETQACFDATCGPPNVAGEGSRYLAVTPAPGLQPVALYVEAANGLNPAMACVSGYIQADATLGADPVFQLPEAWGTVLLKGPEIIPSRWIDQDPILRASYRVREDCGSAAAAAPSFSLGATASTWGWADVNANDLVNVTDIQLIIKAFLHDYRFVTLERADLLGCAPNGLVNVTDLQVALLAFKHRPFAQFCTSPCP